jgi:hypothetical protein
MSLRAACLLIFALTAGSFVLQVWAAPPITYGPGKHIRGQATVGQLIKEVLTR